MQTLIMTHVLRTLAVFADLQDRKNKSAGSVSSMTAALACEVNDTNSATTPIVVRIVFPYFMLDCPLYRLRKRIHT